MNLASKQLRETRKLELVETHNLCLSLVRLQGRGVPYDVPWKRALYHALLLSRVADRGQVEKFRQAMDLP